MTTPPLGTKEYYRDHPVQAPGISFRPIREGRNPMPEILSIVGLSMLAWGMFVLVGLVAVGGMQ